MGVVGRLIGNGLAVSLWLLMLLTGVTLHAVSRTGLAQEAPADVPRVHLLTIDGVINPISARYLEQGLVYAADTNAEAVVLQLDTPGGLVDSTRDMTRAMLDARVPVVVFVAPSGARAASAGMFITIAGHVAAMAPGTNIGAAHPVGLGGQTDPELADKVANDAAALARSIANQRGRNAEWAEQAVLESVSITADEALEQNAIDIVAADVPELLTQIDGRRVQTSIGAVTLATAEAEVVERAPDLVQQILQVLADPNIAYVLMTIGTVGLIAELYNPGTLFPGITGAIALILAFIAFGTLPVNWGGVALVVFGIGLLVFDLYTEGIGVPAVGGLIAFVVGSLFLFSPLTPVSPTAPDVRVNPWLIGGATASVVAFAVFVLGAVVSARRAPVATGGEALMGSLAVAVSDLDPDGLVKLEGENWTAVADAGRVPSGSKVRVTGIEGVTLRVRKL